MHVFVRHPPLPGMHGVCYGRTDIDLPRDVFARAAAALHPRLPPWPIVSSPALRCVGLARALIGIDDASRDTPDPQPAYATRALHTDARLLEMDFGEWERRAWSDIPRPQLDVWARDVAHFRPPGGESFVDLIARVHTALAVLATPHIVVTHAGVIRAALHVSGRMPLETAAHAAIAHATPLDVGIARV